MSAYSILQQELMTAPRTWLVTGVAGFIGAHLLESLLRLDQRVVGLDNFMTGSPESLQRVRKAVSEAQWQRFIFHEGSVTDLDVCRAVTGGVDYVLHKAGFVSVPLSIEQPAACHDINVTGTHNVLLASRDNQVRRVVYASSSAVYGDDARMPKAEEQIGRPLSPYGASKLIGELYAALFVKHYGLECIGLRYFNVFGPGQSPFGGYAAVIPQWITTLLEGKDCRIHGDGSATRDFCHVANVVQANLLAATSSNPAAIGQVYNVALGGSTTLNALYAMICAKLAAIHGIAARPIHYGPPRAGDILHSSADISAIQRDLSFTPEVSVEEGLEETVRWYAGPLTPSVHKSDT
ncbi:MAG: NAD-dependent epimerase/dehydratase [Chthoniobacteraceae bacterium]|nr:NAD-dependent epimerase/dehydratase [Chthoniobacteraceae bacterium]